MVCLVHPALISTSCTACLTVGQISAVPLVCEKLRLPATIDRVSEPYSLANSGKRADDAAAAASRVEEVLAGLAGSASFMHLGAAVPDLQPIAAGTLPDSNQRASFAAVASTPVNCSSSGRRAQHWLAILVSLSPKWTY
jgi:hypothetical protein